MTAKKPKIAIVGATGNVGREVLDIIDDREIQYSDLVALASKKSEGMEINFGEDKKIIVKNLSDYNFEGTDIVIFSAGASISAEYAPIAAKKGCIVIDNTSHFRTDPDVPLVVSEVNPEDIKNFRKKNIIANPNCSTMGMLVAIKPLHDQFKVKRLVVSTYQSVSGSGKEGEDELDNQTRSLLNNKPITKQKFTKQIAFNLIPHIDVFLDDGQTKEEWKMYQETKKILDPNIELTATCVRVPVFVSHSIAVNVEFEKPYEEDQIREIYKTAPGLKVVDFRVDEGYVTPVEVAGLDPVYVSRIRRDKTIANGLNFWCVSDNLRKGAALNTVQITEILIKDYLSS
ncbi:aspartate-semialdehyde dehydrogenase [Alphaproteobacteria bacterium]|nr:aspartate-semialdehyde dehydrogenase [Alphaproteobacteria bacterium]